MTPIEKTILVVDEYGNEYEATYPKRAKGLVKNGRARFIQENKICLLCPPKHITEDNTMSENNKVTPESTTPANSFFPPIPKDENTVSLPYILTQIEKIQSQTDYLYQIIEAVKKSGSDGIGMGAGNIVEEREKTNRQLIAFYERLYDDLRKDKIAEQKENILATAIQSLAEGITPAESSAALQDIVALALQDLNRNN